MQRGNLVIYDETGKIFLQTGEAEGDIISHVYPVGIPYLEIPFGTMARKRLISVDVTKTPHEPVFEDIIIPLTPEEQRIQELENELLLTSGVI